MYVRQSRSAFFFLTDHIPALSIRRVAVFILLLFLASTAAAQRQNNIWYFGNNTGLDFNTSPPTLLYDGELQTNEGTASAADAATGALLFYTQGVAVWNRNHVVMPNGHSLSGNRSTSQSALIVPMPGDSNRYYLFTNGPIDRSANTEAGMVTSIRYSIVDMRLENGDGDVTEKNILLVDSTTEQLHAAAIPGTNEFWVVAHRWGSNLFCAMRVTSSGIQPPVFSAAGPPILGLASSIGCLKLSRDGRHLALSQYVTIDAYLFDFDVKSGVVSNAIKLSTNSQGYGVCFSPDGSKLYCSGGNLMQYDLRSNDSAAINASRHLLDSRSNADGPYYGTLTLGPDGRIYCAAWGYPYLGVINNPNAAKSACGMVREGVKFDRRVQLGLPNMVEIVTPRSLEPDTVTDADFYLPTLCPGNTQRMMIPFYNQRTTDSAVEITFTGPRAGDYTLDTTLPFALTPTRTITFPVIHRWTVPGRWTTTALIRTTSGLVYKMHLHAVAKESFTPVLDLSNIHLGEHDGEFDTCITVTNTYYTRVVFGDTVWNRGGAAHLSLVSPALPAYLPRGASMRLCLHGTSLRRDDTVRLTIGGTILDVHNIEHCVMQILSFDGLPPGTVGVPIDIASSAFPSGVQCIPNPVSGPASITFTVGTRGHARVRLTSIDGAEVAALADGLFEAGSHSVEADVAHLPSGVYLVRVEMESGVRSAIMSVVR